MARKSPFTTELRLQARLAEYHELYQLAGVRIQSLDRRVPVSAATLAAVLGSLHAMPAPSQIVVLLTLPLASLWLVRTTINHARSFEDLLRRIDEIEREVNEDAGATLLAFQSQHPSRLLYPGGRTGMEAVASTLVTAAVTLGAVLGLSLFTPVLTVFDSLAALPLAAGYVALTAAAVLRHAVRWRRYRYRKQLARPSSRSSS